MTSQNMIVVVEFVFITKKENKKPTEVGGGWTYFHPFHPSKGGLDIEQLWSDLEGIEERFTVDEAAKT
jgi:hypothetical protein